MQTHPSGSILLAIGAITATLGAAAILVGAIVGPHILVPAMLILGLASVAIWLARRRWDQLSRVATIIWSVIVMLAILIATILEPPTHDDLPGIIFFGALVLTAATVLAVAVHQRPTELTD